MAYPYEINKIYKNKYISLVKKLNVRAAELIFKQKDNEDLILHYISTFPNWLKADSNYRSEIYQTLATKLINDSNPF